MQIGVVFPQTEIGADIAVIRAYAAAAEELGYGHVLAYDHVLGADPDHYVGWSGPYDVDDTFHEVFVLYGYLAAITSMELVTGILILPQRQTALVAKQAAQVDILTQGRFRLGVGLGWNAVEYEALGQRFDDRGRRLEEQIELLRLLWTRRSVTFGGRYESVTAAGLAPLPVQRPIPIWVGGSAPAALRRAGRVADGWFPQVRPGPGGGLDEALALVREGAESVGRDPAAIAMEGRVGTSRGPEVTARQIEAWRGAGATHVSVSTTGIGAIGVDAHIAALVAVAEAIGLPRRAVS